MRFSQLVVPIRFRLQPGAATTAEAAPAPPDDPEPAPAVPEAAPSDDLAAAPAAHRPTRLGWLAAGRPWKGITTPLFVPAFVANDQTAVRVIVPGRGIVLAATAQTGGYQFMALPRGGTVVGMRYENGTPFLAREPHVPGAAPDTLRFREISLADLETTLARLQ